MNPFEYIKELKQAITIDATNQENNDKVIPYKEHCSKLINMLNILEIEMKQAEYNYQVTSVNYNDIITFDELTVMQKELNDEVIIFQPVAVNESEFSDIDMQSLADVLTKLKNNNIIKQNILLLPPNINVFKAVLKQPKEISLEEDEK